MKTRSATLGLLLASLSVLAVAACGGGDDGGEADFLASAGGATAGNGAGDDRGGSASGGSPGLALGGSTGTAGAGSDPCDVPNPPEECQGYRSDEPACGDGELNQDSEVCDDGNTFPGDGCNGICKVEPNWECPTAGAPCEPTYECGNGAIEPGEVCDAGPSGEGCLACEAIDPNYVCPTPGEACTRVVICGDGKVNSVTGRGDEQCDDGNVAEGDGCDANCQLEFGYSCPIPGQSCETAPACGDGILQPTRGESCDDGNRDVMDGCDGSCTLEGTHACPTPGMACTPITARCGDGIVQASLGETCDDNNAVGTDGCSATCQIEDGWTCPLAGALCAPACGDGKLRGAEACDDGNNTVDDGCSLTCQWEDGWACVGGPGSYTCSRTVCGDGKIGGTEGCDDGNNDLGDGCTPLCQIEPSCTPGSGCTSSCGDGIVIAPEACDDGNVRNGDGCSSTCQVEAGFQCEQPPIGSTLRVPVVYRDFNASHPDFQPGGASMCGGAIQPNMIKATLGADGKPQFNQAGSGCNQLTSAATLAQWYTDVPGVNVSKAGALVLYDNGSGGYVNRWGDNGEQWSAVSGEQWCGNNGACSTYNPSYSPPPASDLVDCTCGGPGNYQNAACNLLNNPDNECYQQGGDWRVRSVSLVDGTPVFFPVDDLTSITPQSQFQGANIADEVYGGGWQPEPNGSPHNFHFTSEVRFWFEYDASGNTTLDFTGDDDVWVFVNGRRAVNLGGIHSPVNGSVNLQSSASALGLQDGKVYEIVVFQAERQITGSSYRLTLSGFNASASVCGPICGDGEIGPGEQCDEGPGGNNGGYGQCQSDCTLGPRCGDGTQQSGEACDNGVNLGGYGESGCAPGCVEAPRCGDGTVDYLFGEKCDGGANCTAACQFQSFCGDGTVDAGEECDLGNNDGGYNSCNDDCTLTVRCGDGTVQAEWGEQCDDGNLDNGDGCSEICRDEGACGDGIVDPGETCDDGDNDGGYGECGPECTGGPRCGDGAVQSEYEECDDGVNDGGYGECSPGCKLGPVCGDGTLQSVYEQCDDGNNVDGDGCSAACKQEILIQ